MPDRTDPDDGTPDEVRDALVTVAFTVMALLNRAAAAHDLSSSQLRLLGILRDRRPRMAELAEFLGLDRSSVSGLVDRAAARGLVRREAAEGDGRSVRVALTAEGRRLATRVAGEVGRLVTPMTAHLTPAEQRRLAALLDRLVDAPPADTD